MSRLLDEHAQDVGREVREFARLHVDLARSEVRDASTRVVLGLRLIVLGAVAAALALVAGGLSLFLVLQTKLSSPAAAAVVALVYAVIAGASDGLGGRFLAAGRSLSLPRTRAMLRELMQWHEKPTDS